MFINSGAVKYSRKRKANEGEVEYFDLSKDDDLTFPFTSFTSLLLQDDDDDDDQHQIPNTHLHDQQIDQIIKTHCKSLKRTLADQRRTDYTALRNAAEKQIREKEAELEHMERRKLELEQTVAHFRKEVQVWKDRARSTEETVEYLREMLWEAKKSGESTEEEEEEEEVGSGGGGWRERLRCTQGLRVEEDAESSYVEPAKVEMTRQGACKACGKRVATVLMWPCRHVAVCGRCEGANKVKECPVCLSPKTAAIEVILS